MKEIVESITRLSNSYNMLSENANQIFNTLKIKDYKKKEILEQQTQELYKRKDINELYLIHLVKEKAEELGLEEKRIEAILNIHSDKEEIMRVQYELDEMLKNINMFQFCLKRNIEFAGAFMEAKGKEVEIMFEVIQREKIEQGGHLLLNEEF